MPPSGFTKASPNHALHAFNSGYNCAQSVVKVYAEILGFDERDAISKAAGLGGGGFQGICGAVSGACLVLELFCSGVVGPKGQKRCLESLIGAFRQQFQQMHHTDQCEVLLRDETNQPKNSAHSICERCIIDAVEIINRLLEQTIR